MRILSSSLGDGQVNLISVFSKLAQYDFPGWAVLEWECCLKHPEDGAIEGDPFIKKTSFVLQIERLMIFAG